MAATFVVDLTQAVDAKASVSVGSGSDLLVGQIVDLGLDHGGLTNVFCAAHQGSGAIELRIQTSDALTSGSFTDPTSGRTTGQFPPGVVSGGIAFMNSGIAWGSGAGSFYTPAGSGAPLFCSGGVQFAAFHRPHRYARLIYNSGPFLNWLVGGFVAQKHVTGSGAGYTPSPGSGAVNV